jgi:hypothetical protein
MKHEREFDTSYFPKPHSTGGELLPLHHLTEGDDVDGVEGATKNGSVNVSPPILAVFRSVWCVSCFFAVP